MKKTLKTLAVSLKNYVPPFAISQDSFLERARLQPNFPKKFLAKNNTIVLLHSAPYFKKLHFKTTKNASVKFHEFLLKKKGIETALT